MLEDIPVHQHAGGVLQLEEVFDRPRNASVRTVPGSPGELLCKVVSADLDVGGHKIRDRRNSSPEKHVDSRRLQIVVDDLEGTGAIPAHDRLVVGANLLE